MANYREISFLGMILEADPEHYKPDVAYEFSNDREFESTDHTDSGIYEDD